MNGIHGPRAATTMPRIFDNIDQHSCRRCKRRSIVRTGRDFCVGYFNLRGWKQIDSLHRTLVGRRRTIAAGLLVGMQRLPQEELRAALSLDQGRRRNRQPDGASTSRRSSPRSSAIN